MKLVQCVVLPSCTLWIDADECAYKPVRFAGYPAVANVQASNGRHDMALSILGYLAIIGILGRAAWRSGPTEKAMFVVNVVLLWVSAIWLYGYPALIGPAIVAAASILAMLVVMTSSDLIEPAGVEPAE